MLPPGSEVAREHELCDLRDQPDDVIAAIALLAGKARQLTRSRSGRPIAPSPFNPHHSSGTVTTVTTSSVSVRSILENALPAKPRNTSVFVVSARYVLDGDTHTGTDPIDPARLVMVVAADHDSNVRASYRCPKVVRIAQPDPRHRLNRRRYRRMVECHHGAVRRGRAEFGREERKRLGI